MKVSCDVCRELCKQPTGSIVMKCGAFVRKESGKDVTAPTSDALRCPVKTTVGRKRVRVPSGA